MAADKRGGAELNELLTKKPKKESLAVTMNQAAADADPGGAEVVHSVPET